MGGKPCGERQRKKETAMREGGRDEGEEREREMERER
jgi:hypothetical protein